MKIKLIFLHSRESLDHRFYSDAEEQKRNGSLRSIKEVVQYSRLHHHHCGAERKWCNIADYITITVDQNGSGAI
jgi:hypothetical protein